MAMYGNTDFYYTFGKYPEQDKRIHKYLSKSTQLDSDEDNYISSIANELIDILGADQAAAFVDRYLYTQDADECIQWLFKKLEPYASNNKYVQEFIKDHEQDIEPLTEKIDEADDEKDDKLSIDVSGIASAINDADKYL